MKKIIILFAALAVLSSCTDEHIWFGGSKEIGIKTVDIYRTARIPSTKSDGSELLCSFPLPSDETDREYSLEVWISDAVTEPATKGTQINDVSSLATKDGYGSFIMDAYSGNTIYNDGQSALKGLKVIFADDNWIFDDGQKYFWPDEGDLTFCSYSPEDAPVTKMKYDSSKSQVSFEYSLPSHTADNNDAINQKDVMFGVDTENRLQDHGNAYIHFYHALTSVKFVNSDLKGVKVKSVTLKNFYGSGSAVFSKSEKGGKTEATFVWTPDETSGLKSYTQDFNTAFKSDALNANGDKSFDTTSDGSMTFMMIPQKLDPTAQIIIEFDRQSHNQIVLNVGNLDKDDFWSPENEANRINEAQQLMDWSLYAGKTITFRVSMKDMGVASLDLTGNATDGFVVTNNGTDPVYVRATMVVNLEDASDKVIKTCFETDSPKMYSYSPIDTGKWTLNTENGYWYSNEKLEAGSSLEFIKGFTPDISGIVYDHIDVSVLMQGVFDNTLWN